MVVIFLRKLTKICSLWNRTRKELLFIAALVILVLHYAFLNDSLNIAGSEMSVNELPMVRWPLLLDNATCAVPRLDPLDGEVAKYEQLPEAVACGGEVWVRCYRSKCNQTDEIQEKFSSVTCEFRDIISSERTNFTLGPVRRIRHNETYELVKSDHVMVSCSGINITDGKAVNWSGVATALRATPDPPLAAARSARFSVMVLVFDTLSANGFQRHMPASFETLKKVLRATFLRGYSTIGGGTASALLPILTGKSELELMEARGDNPHSWDSAQGMYRKLKTLGYRTAFFEDIPSKSTILDSLGFKDPPADHLFPKSILTAGSDASGHCIGDTPEYKIILNVTEQFMDLEGDRFGLTFVADLTKSDFSMVQTADEDTAALLLGFRRHARDALLVVMSDHGPRNKRVRDTRQGRLEERLPLLAVVLPRELMRRRPHAAAALADNADAVTTPYDLHATLLDVLGIETENETRGRSLLETIPKNRTCSDVGVGPHWCVCLAWEHVAPSDPMYRRTAGELVRYINTLLTEVGSKCAPRNLTSIAWVTRQIMPSGGLAASNRDVRREENNPNYQIKVNLKPGKAMYEATMLYVEREDRFVTKAGDISRTNMGAYESLCVDDTHPHLAPFCYCQYH